MKTYHAEYHIKNKDTIAAKSKIWRDNNREHRQAHDKEYRNQPEMKEHFIEYRKKNANKTKKRNEARMDEIKARRKIYAQENKEIISVKRKQYANKDNEHYVNLKNKLENFIKKKLSNNVKQQRSDKYDITIDYDYLKDLWEKQKGKCYITGLVMTHKAYSGRVQTNGSIDQIEAGKGYIDGNVGFCCEFINLSKMQMSVDEFKKQLLFAGENLKNKLHENIKSTDNIENEMEVYLLTLFSHKKLVDKLGRENIINLYKKQGGCCAISGIKMSGVKNPSIKHRNPTNISIDKIDPKKGYILDNIQLTCLWTNTGKQQLSTEEYRKLLLEAYESMIKLE